MKFLNYCNFQYKIRTKSGVSFTIYKCQCILSKYHLARLDGIGLANNQLPSV